MKHIIKWAVLLYIDTLTGFSNNLIIAWFVNCTVDDKHPSLCRKNLFFVVIESLLNCRLQVKVQLCLPAMHAPVFVFYSKNNNIPCMNCFNEI